MLQFWQGLPDFLKNETDADSYLPWPHSVSRSQRIQKIPFRVAGSNTFSKLHLVSILENILTSERLHFRLAKRELTERRHFPMSLTTLTRRSILISCSLMAVALCALFLLSVRTSTQKPQVLNEKDKDALIQQIENSVDQPLKFVGNEDCPLKIVQATVKEIPGYEFTRLTRKTTDLVTVSSVPEVRLLNTSERTIAGFVLAVRHPQSDMNRGVVLPKASIPPAGTYEVNRKDFVSPEKLTVTDDGQIHQKLVQPKLDKEKYWIQFAQRSDVFVFVSMIVFDDGSEWKAKRGGELK